MFLWNKLLWLAVSIFLFWSPYNNNIIISFCREHPAHVIWFYIQLLRLSHSVMCRQYDWCWVTHTPLRKKTILHIVFLCVPKRGSMIVTWKSELKLLSVNISKLFDGYLKKAVTSRKEFHRAFLAGTPWTTSSDFSLFLWLAAVRQLL